MTSNIFIRYLSLLGVPHTQWYSSKIYDEEPFNRSLYGISVLLSRYRIPNKCVRFADKEQLSSELTPFLAVVDVRFGIVTSVSESSVTMLDADGSTRSLSRDTFLKRWNGVGLFASPDRRSSEPDIVRHRRDSIVRRFKRLAIVVAAVVSAFAAVSVGGCATSLIWWSLLFVNAVGIYVSLLLLRKQLNIPDRVADKICGFSHHSHCDKVTSSEASSVLGLFKLSEVGFAFFSVNLIILLFFPTAMFWIAVVAGCTLPFTFWSLWYQRFRARSWCMLCLATLSVLWLQAIICLVGNVYSIPAGGLAYGVALVGAYVVFTLSLNHLMDILARYRESRSWRHRYAKLKMSEKVVAAYEGDRPIVDVNPEHCTSMVFGNPDASRTVTVFSNPYCGPCANMHGRINDYPSDDVCVRYVMTFFSEDRSIINRYLIAAYFQLGAEAAWELMGRWFDGGKARGEAFFDGLELDPYAPDVEAEFRRQRAWRESSGREFSGTPTVLVNGREVVEPYVVEDYLYLS